jgi:hypothetical protein
LPCERFARPSSGVQVACRLSLPLAKVQRRVIEGIVIQILPAVLFIIFAFIVGVWIYFYLAVVVAAYFI